MENKYDLDNLIKTFQNHSEKYEKQRIEFREKHGEPTYDDSFNICKAFLCFAKEIKEIKEFKEKNNIRKRFDKVSFDA